MKPSAFILLVFFLPLVSASQCTRNTHCDDGNPATHDACLHEHAKCLSFSTDRQNSVNTIRNLQDLKAELNEPNISAEAKSKTALIAARAINEMNPNLFIYRNVGGTNPAKALERFAKTIRRQTSNFEFHTGMADIFRTANDFHTAYSIPAPFNKTVAVLGFSARVFYGQENGGASGNRMRRYVVSDVIKSLIPDDSSLGIGVELLRYNDLAIDALVLREGGLTYASNIDARVESGTKAIYRRFLAAVSLPKSDRVMLEYRTAEGVRGNITLPWIYVQLGDDEMAAEMAGEQGMDEELEENLRELKRGRSLKHKEIDVPRAPNTSVRVTAQERTDIFVEAALRRVFFAEMIPTKSGTIGRIQIKTFNARPTLVVLTELVRILNSMPTGGLVIDIRGNPGGLVTLTEDIGFLITGGRLSGFPVAWRATELMRDSFVSINTTDVDAVDSIIAAVNDALRIKGPVSGGTATLFQRNSFTRTGSYPGPIITLADAGTYSAGDLYAAMQVDGRTSLLVGTAGATGGGGALVASYSELAEIFPRTLEPLPSAVTGFSIAVARLFRSGRNRGGQYEYFGVEPDVRYFPTRDDALKEDCDLYEFLGAKLKELQERNTGV